MRFLHFEKAPLWISTIPRVSMYHAHTVLLSLGRHCKAKKYWIWQKGKCVEELWTSVINGLWMKKSDAANCREYDVSSEASGWKVKWYAWYLAQTAVVLDLFLKVWSWWMERHVEKNSSAGCWSFLSGDGSVDCKTQNGDHSRAQSYSQPKWSVAHVWTI